MDEMKNAAAAFHTWHSNRTYYPDQPGIDPWMRDVLVNLQRLLNTMAAKIDQQDRQIQELQSRIR